MPASPGSSPALACLAQDGEGGWGEKWKVSLPIGLSKKKDQKRGRARDHAGRARVQPSSRAPDEDNLFGCRCLLAAGKGDWTEGLGCRRLPSLEGIPILPNPLSEFSTHLSASASLLLSLPLVTSHLGMSKCKMQKPG